MNLLGYYHSHAPFASAFLAKHGVSIESVLITLTALLLWLQVRWTKEGFGAFWNDSQRAYLGPVKRSTIRRTVKVLWDSAARKLGLRVAYESEQADLAFFALENRDRSGIDLILHGPHALLLPSGRYYWFVDYARILEILNRLFHNVTLRDQSFKGAVLEQFVQPRTKILPTAPCKSLSGQTKQIDAAFGLGELLVIAEAKSKSLSLAFERGDEAALRLRRDFLTRALSDVDTKAVWLATNPVGRNYDIRSFRAILPLVVSPFKEFIWSMDRRLWLDAECPRILMPHELRGALDNGVLMRAYVERRNTVEIEPDP